MYSLRLIMMFFFSFILAGSAYELRVWEDVDGNRFEGRFVKELFGKLTVEAEDGSTKTFELENLSELDQKYLRVKVPPKAELAVEVKSTSIEPRPMTIEKEMQMDAYQVNVKVTKKSQRPFTSRLKAEIFLIAEEVEGDNYVLLERTEKEFLMPTISKGTEVELKSKIAKTLKFRDEMSSALKGEDFKGYLAVISSMEGEIVLLNSNLPAWLEDPQVIQNLRELSITGAPSVYSRHFDKTGKKVPPPRPAHGSPQTD